MHTELLYYSTGCNPVTNTVLKFNKKKNLPKQTAFHFDDKKQAFFKYSVEQHQRVVPRLPRAGRGMFLTRLRDRPASWPRVKLSRGISSAAPAGERSEEKGGESLV